jgi:phage pi2 protein 07
MYTKFAVEHIAESINAIIIPKFNKYTEDRRNDVSLQPLIDAEIKKIEEANDLVENLMSSVEIDKDTYNSISLNGYTFYYNNQTESWDFSSNDIAATVKSNLLYKEGLQNDWRVRDLIKDRIIAIIATVDESNDHDAILKIVEDQIDFNEFINLAKDR